MHLSSIRIHEHTHSQAIQWRYNLDWCSTLTINFANLLKRKCSFSASTLCLITLLRCVFTSFEWSCDTHIPLRWLDAISFNYILYGKLMVHLPVFVFLVRFIWFRGWREWEQTFTFPAKFPFIHYHKNPKQCK